MSTKESWPGTWMGATGAATSWWERAGGGREVLNLALPLILSTASWAVMHFVDRMFLFWRSPVDTAAALSAGTILWTVLGLPLGIASYLNTFVAQYFGAGRPQRIGQVLFQGVLFSWATVPLFLFLIPVSDFAFSWLGHDPELAQRESTYFQVNCWGAGAAVLAGAYACFYTGRGMTRTVMLIDVASSLINVVLDYLLIFGAFGFPEWGIAGAAWATVAAQWTKVLIYLLLLRAPDLRQQFGIDEGRRLDRELLRRLIRFGVPNGFQMQLEGLAFTIFVIYVARLGTLASASTTLAISINVVAFVPMIGLGIAISTLVGQHLGADQPRLAAQAVWSGLLISLVYNGIFGVLYVLAPELFLLAHSAGSSELDTRVIRETTIVLLRFVAGYCLFDAIQLTFCCAIKGAGDTRFVLWTTFVTSALAVTLIEWGVSWQDWGLMWCWTVLLLWIVLLAVIYSARFLHGGWTKLRVIEPELGT